jgi:DNA-directed RNA polymerase subunit RPC12/RpoP
VRSGSRNEAAHVYACAYCGKPFNNLPQWRDHEERTCRRRRRVEAMWREIQLRHRKRVGIY